MGAVVEVRGARELRAALRWMGDDGLKKELGAANKSAAQVVVDAALPNVPVGATGLLKASVRALGSQASGRALAGNAGVSYAAPIHWGRKQGNVGSPPGNRKGPNRVAGRPFLWNAAQDRLAQVVAQYADAMARLCDQIHT